MSLRFSELDEARIGVWGAGREIASFAAQLARRLPRARIVAGAFDAPPAADVRETLRAPDARIVGAGEAVQALSGCDVIVRSPGVSIHRRELRELCERGVPVTTATSLWLAEHGGAGVLGVTGTKGKSTTAALIHHLVRATGINSRLAGNIGVPALDLLDAAPAELIVLELSSYQIADLQSAPELALFTNLFREHADWHGSLETYLAEKLRLLELPGLRVAVLNARDERLARVTLPVGAQVAWYGRPDGWDVRDGAVALRGESRARVEQLPIPGEHNALNLCGALSALEAYGIAPPEDLAAALEGFAALPHRLQTVLERDGVLWVDDSISTTPESALAALASFPARELILIAGGQDRGQDHAALAAALLARGATLIAVPTTGPRLLAAAHAAGIAPERALEARDMAAAVELAGALAPAGGVVLLSPAAPSYDRYANFEERGRRFGELASALASDTG